MALPFLLLVGIMSMVSIKTVSVRFICPSPFLSGFYTNYILTNAFLQVKDVGFLCGSSRKLLFSHRPPSLVRSPFLPMMSTSLDMFRQLVQLFGCQELLPWLTPT
jgi:hypothetical protein